MCCYPCGHLAMVAHALVCQTQKCPKLMASNFKHLFYFNTCQRSHQIYITNRLFKHIFCMLKYAYIFCAPLYRMSPKSILWRDILAKEMKKIIFITLRSYTNKYRLKDYWNTSSLTRISIFGKLISDNA